jgi:hypothetical protein
MFFVLILFLILKVGSSHESAAHEQATGNDVDLFGRVLISLALLTPQLK